jgi:FtsP/CotA-like multicopper oxidase with cupredoxin domain
VPEVDLNYLEYALEAREKSQVKDFPKASDVTRRVTIVAHQRVNGPTTWINNNYSWFESFPHEPYLVSLYQNHTGSFPNLTRAIANQGIDPVTRAFPAQVGEVIEIVLQNTGADKGGLDAHPWHAHGAHYYDLGSGNGTYDPVANERRWADTGRKPIKRDTTMLYRYGKTTGNFTEQGWRAWRVKVDQPGVWMVHCHVLQHMLMGMQTVWVVGDRHEVLNRVGFPDVIGYLAFGGSVVGNETRWPRVVEHFTP